MGRMRRIIVDNIGPIALIIGPVLAVIVARWLMGETWITVDNISLIALIIGPMLAVIVARWLEDRRVKRERWMTIFRILMATRRNRLSPEHVSSLNLVEIEFRDYPEVLRKWKDYFTDLCSVVPRQKDEELVGDPNEDRLREERYRKRISDNRTKLLTQLLHEMAKALDYKIEALDIFEGGYSPEGWGYVEDQQEIMRRYFVELYFGQRALPVVVYNNEPKTDQASDSNNPESAAEQSAFIAPPGQ